MKTTVLFISGVGRSGTTLVERAVSTSKDTASLGEVTHLWRRGLLMDELCGCGMPFSRCTFWRQVGDGAFGGWNNVDVNAVLAARASLDRVSRIPRLLWGLGDTRYRQKLNHYGELYARTYRSAAQVSGARVVIDSSKQPSMPFVLSHQKELDVRVVHCIRDSRAVAYSWTKTVPRPEARVESFGTMTRYSPARMSVVWLAHNTAAGAARAAGLPVLSLRYEDFVEAPRATVARILGFCGLPAAPPDEVSDHHVDLQVAHTCSGNPLRFAAGRVLISRDDVWRERLPTRSKRLVSALTFPLLRRHGYLGPSA